MKVNNNTCGYTNMYLDKWECSMKGGKLKAVIVKLVMNTTVIGLEYLD